MTDLSIRQDHVFRLVLVWPSTTLILVELRGNTLHLPRFSIPCGTRVAEQIQAAIKARWGVKGVIIEVLAREGDNDRIAIVEALPIGDSTVVQRISSISDLDEGELSAAERSKIVCLLARGSDGRGPFDVFGWFGKALDWITPLVPVGRLELVDGMQQFNAGTNFALIRFGNPHQSAYWLKAVGEPNINEFPITLRLADLFSDFLPPILASRRDWRAWLMKDAGKPLDEVITMPRAEQVMRRLATLQQASAVQVDLLLSTGCYDQRLPILRSVISVVMDYLEESMMKQTSHKVQPLGAGRLREIAVVLEDACFSLEGLDIPATLLHNDINPGNILVGTDKIVFADWAEAGIGNPFVTFEHLRIQAGLNDRMKPWIKQMVEAYTSSWRLMLSEYQIQRALILVPLIAVFSYLYGRGEWLFSERRHDPFFQGYARSLARHMDRAALTLAQRDWPCA